MDLVVQAAATTLYVDVVCYHPFTGKGAKRTAAAGGTTTAQEERKHQRYQVVDPVTRRRNTMAALVPVAISSYGLVGPTAVAAFSVLEAEAKGRHPENHRAKGWLQELASAAAVYGTARCVMRAYAPPDGQERAHLLGRAAS